MKVTDTGPKNKAIRIVKVVTENYIEERAPFGYGYSFTWGAVCALSSVYLVMRVIQFILDHVK